MLRIEKIHPGEQFTIDPRESAFSHGAGIFETLQVAEGYLQFWSRHWSRLKASALRLFSCDLSAEDEAASLEAIKAFCSDIGQKDQVLKLSLIVLATGPVLYIYLRERTIQEASVKLYLNQAHPINENALYVGHKTHNYLENIWLLREAKLTGYADYLRVNTQGELCETCIGNCFFIKGDQIITPSIETGLFPGIIRAVLLEALPIEETQIKVEDLLVMEGCFVTNSIVEILPVIEIAGISKQTAYSFSGNALSKIEEIKVTLKTIAKSEAINLF